MTATSTDRRLFPRFALEPMYTPVAVQCPEARAFDNEGHVYDISEGGVRFEADKPIKPGSPIAMQITLPNTNPREIEPGRTVFVYGKVVWLEDEDEPGPYKMAAEFTRYAKAQDRERLLRQFATGRYRAAA
ncbi:MAG TPA: PilZ domain-containing protein [Phycisphaerales bacterium]|nr:PilZ domain-containing protein [Phycisphaerales bacterium]